LNENKTTATTLSPAAVITPGFISRKIGNTVYRVSVYFSETSKECLEDKILRLAGNDLTCFTKNSLAFAEKSGIMSLPQTGWLLDGGSL